MLKYKGKYRIVCEFNRNTLEPIKDDLYIQCAKGGQIYRILNDTLAYYRPTRGNSCQFADKLTQLGVKNVKNYIEKGVYKEMSDEEKEILRERFRANISK